ncbi:hypothetical protein [Cycloclasticus pugetii]|uniref:hypothetical protein n=1 Tax=Cycloclasticus pugetii TaxID=34068 RepID=UPI0003721879|nr:hypothetical protein [Cycloclasticus pugetii]
MQFKNTIMFTVLFCMLFLSLQTSAETKWHPGHYIYVYPNQDEPRYFYSVMRELRANPIFRGVQKKYFWNKLEPQFGVYDFSEIRNDLANLKIIDKYLILSVQAESFVTNEKFVPDYLLTNEYDGGVYPINTGKGYNVAYYNHKVQERLIALVAALGEEFDRNSQLEAINFEETSPSRNEPKWHKAHIKEYITGMLRVARAAKISFPNTTVIQYVNYPESSLNEVTDTLIAYGIGMGGPDVYSQNRHLEQGVYSYYPKIAGAIPIGMAVDYHNYQSSTGGEGIKNRPSVASIHKFAMSKLKPNYMFWLRRTAEPWNGTDYWQDVIDYFNKFDWHSDPVGGLESGCPSLVAPCL